MGETKLFERLSADVISTIEKRWQGAERGPYLIVTDPKKVGDDWFVANLGCGEDGKEVWLTTDHVHASEVSATAESQAEFFAHASCDMRTLGQALGAAYKEIDRLTGQRLWQRWWEPRRRMLRRLYSRWMAWHRRHQVNPFGREGALRWWLAKRLNKRKDVCWPACVSWAMNGAFWEWRELGGAEDCMRYAGTDGSCWCGKFATQAYAEEYFGGAAGSIIVTPTGDSQGADSRG